MEVDGKRSSIKKDGGTILEYHNFQMLKENDIWQNRGKENSSKGAY